MRGIKGVSLPIRLCDDGKGSVKLFLSGYPKTLNNPALTWPFVDIWEGQAVLHSNRSMFDATHTPFHPDLKNGGSVAKLKHLLIELSAFCLATWHQLKLPPQKS